MTRDDRGWLEITDVLIRALSGVLIPVAIFVAGFLISEQQRKAELARQNADQIARLLEHLASERARERLLAIEFMKRLATDPNASYPRELIVALISVAETDENSKVALAASSALGTTAQSRSDLSSLIRKSLEDIPPRVYIHIRSEQQRAPASRIGAMLEEKGYVVPGVERLVDVGPNGTQLRFIRSGEKQEAEKIVALLGENGVTAELRDLSARYEKSTSIRPRHYELWFSPDDFVAQP